jgi:DNA (cytosine-5)-methyltransferase 1
MSVGALCAGYGGIELGLSTIVETELVWHSEICEVADTIMKQRFGTPNLGDLLQINEPPECDIVTAGFPCQPVSLGGYRKGIEDERWIIEDVCKVARKAGARFLILENVSGILTANNGDAMGRVVQAMAQNGFGKFEWDTIRASDTGAPHRRERWFCVATNSESAEWGNKKSETMETTTRPTAEFRERTGTNSGTCIHTETEWEQYEPAIRRWESLIGRAAPRPDLADGSLSHYFVEWQMGLPEGWVTGNDLGLGQSDCLKVLGNGVVPQQAQTILEELLGKLI